MQTKKIPMRRCVACREMKPKKELIRVVKTADDIVVDTTGKVSGRGAYICRNIECFSKAKKKNSLSVELGTNISEKTYEDLLKEIDSGR